MVGFLVRDAAEQSGLSDADRTEMISDCFAALSPWKLLPRDFLAMSTAHRPTFNPAIASEIMGGVLRHGASGTLMAKDQKGQTTMKLRQDGQNSEADIKGRDLRAELEDRERKAFEIKNKEKSKLRLTKTRARCQAPVSHSPLLRPSCRATQTLASSPHPLQPLPVGPRTKAFR
jgi:hypothetical protein